MKKARIGTNPNATKEKVFDQIVKYGPVSAKAIASVLEIREKQAMQRVSYMVSRMKVNIQKRGKKGNREYFYDENFPVVGAPSLTEQKEEKEADDLFDELVEGQDQLAPMKQETIIEAGSSFKRERRGLDTLVNRCHHLVLALENCSSNTIQDSFNLDEEQARILMNKVVSKFDGLSVNFCINVKKEK